MESLLPTVQTIAAVAAVLGGKLGLVSAFALPAALVVARIAGERFFRLYARLTTAGVGLAIGTLLGQLVKLAGT